MLKLSNFSLALIAALLLPALAHAQLPLPDQTTIVNSQQITVYDATLPERERNRRMTVGLLRSGLGGGGSSDGVLTGLTFSGLTLESTLSTGPGPSVALPTALSQALNDVAIEFNTTTRAFTFTGGRANGSSFTRSVTIPGGGTGTSDGVLETLTLSPANLLTAGLTVGSNVTVDLSALAGGSGGGGTPLIFKAQLTDLDISQADSTTFTQYLDIDPNDVEINTGSYTMISDADGRERVCVPSDGYYEIASDVAVFFADHSVERGTIRMHYTIRASGSTVDVEQPEESRQYNRGEHDGVGRSFQSSNELTAIFLLSSGDCIGTQTRIGQDARPYMIQGDPSFIEIVRLDGGTGGSGGGSGDITAVTTSANSGLGGGADSGDVALQLDIENLELRTGLQGGDAFAFEDISRTGDPTQRITFSNICNHLAGTNLSCDSQGVLSAAGGGDITAVQVGTTSGLSGGGQSGSVSVALNPFGMTTTSSLLSSYVIPIGRSSLDARKATLTTLADFMCAGTGMSAANGVCSASVGDITEVSTPSHGGLSGGGNTGALALRLDLSNLDTRINLEGTDRFAFMNDSDSSDTTRGITVENLCNHLAGSNLTCSGEGELSASGGGGGGTPARLSWRGEYVNGTSYLAGDFVYVVRDSERVIWLADEDTSSAPSIAPGRAWLNLTDTEHYRGRVFDGVAGNIGIYLEHGDMFIYDNDVWLVDKPVTITSNEIENETEPRFNNLIDLTEAIVHRSPADYDSPTGADAGHIYGEGLTSNLRIGYLRDGDTQEMRVRAAHLGRSGGQFVGFARDSGAGFIDTHIAGGSIFPDVPSLDILGQIPSTGGVTFILEIDGGGPFFEAAGITLSIDREDGVGSTREVSLLPSSIDENFFSSAESSAVFLSGVRYDIRARLSGESEDVALHAGDHIADIIDSDSLDRAEAAIRRDIPRVQVNPSGSDGATALRLSVGGVNWNLGGGDSGSAVIETLFDNTDTGDAAFSISSGPAGWNRTANMQLDRALTADDDDKDLRIRFRYTQDGQIRVVDLQLRAAAFRLMAEHSATSGTVAPTGGWFAFDLMDGRDGRSLTNTFGRLGALTRMRNGSGDDVVRVIFNLVNNTVEAVSDMRGKVELVPLGGGGGGGGNGITRVTAGYGLSGGGTGSTVNVSFDPDELDEVLTLASADRIVAIDTSDSNRGVEISRTNLAISMLGSLAGEGMAVSGNALVARGVRPVNEASSVASNDQFYMRGRERHEQPGPLDRPFGPASRAWRGPCANDHVRHRVRPQL